MSVGYNPFEWYEKDLDDEYKWRYMMSLEEKLETCTGTEQYHRLNLTKILCTDGVKMFADEGGAYWCVDEICIQKIARKELKDEEFLAIEVISKNNKAEIYFEDGDKKLLFKYYIPFTDLEEGTYKFYLTDGVLLLRSEY